MTPSLLGVIPYAGIDFAVYETLREVFLYLNMAFGSWMLIIIIVKSHPFSTCQMYMVRNPDVAPNMFAVMACGAISSSVGQVRLCYLALSPARCWCGFCKCICIT